MKTIKENISRIILDSVEGLPKFRRGAISRLQDIRERQRKWASDDYLRRKPPENSSIDLHQITLVITFEHEEFSVIHKGIKKYFPKNDKTKKLIQAIKETEDSLHAASWHNLGYISKSSGLLVPDIMIDEKIPPEISHVSLSYHRISPSIACVIFEFLIEEYVSKNLKIIQDKEYIGKIEFKRFCPLKKIHQSYSMSGNGGEQSILRKEKDFIRVKIEKWVSGEFNWKDKESGIFSYIDAYKISGNPIPDDECNTWLKSNNQWLDDYGVSIFGFNVYRGDGMFYVSNRYKNEHFRVSDTIAKIDYVNNSKHGDYFSFKVRGIAVSAAIFILIEKYQNKAEKLRALGFKNIYRSKNIAMLKPKNIQDLKKLIVVISRLKHEIEQSGAWISHSISEVGKLYATMDNKEFNLGHSTIINTKYQLDQLKSAIEIIDKGLTEYLSIQNIYAMYKLQKNMFYLTVVALIVAIVSVLTGWDKLVTGWSFISSLVDAYLPLIKESFHLNSP